MSTLEEFQAKFREAEIELKQKEQQSAALARSIESSKLEFERLKDELASRVRIKHRIVFKCVVRHKCGPGNGLDIRFHTVSEYEEVKYFAGITPVMELTLSILKSKQGSISVTPIESSYVPLDALIDIE